MSKGYAQCTPFEITTNTLFTEDFTGAQAVDSLQLQGVVPSCWERIYTGAAAGYDPKVFNGTTAVTSGNNCLAISSGLKVTLSLSGMISSSLLNGFNIGDYIDSAGTTNYVILPKLVNNLNVLQMSFTSKMSSDSIGVLEIGYFTDPISNISDVDVSTFVTIATIPNTTASTSQTIFFGDYLTADLDANLVLRWTDLSSIDTTAFSNLNMGNALSILTPLISRFSGFATCYIDNISIQIAPTCIEPSNVTVSNITDATAQISWTAGTADQDLWQISYNDSIINVNTNPYTLTNLTLGTEYTVNVRALCTDDTSYWGAQPVTFSTSACTSITVTEETPYFEDFSAYQGVDSMEVTGIVPDCWDRIYTGTSAGYDPKVYNGTDAVTSGNNCLALAAGTMVSMTTGFSFTMTGSSNYVILPTITNDLSDLEMFFTSKMAADTTSMLEIGYFTDASATVSNIDVSTFVALQAIPVTSAATNQIVEFAQLPGIQNFVGRLVFRWSNSANFNLSDFSSFSNFLSLPTCYIDNITLRLVRSCAEPTDVTISHISDVSAVVDWTPADASHNLWEISYSDTIISVTSHPYTLTGLTSSTDYEVNVRTVCTDENSYWATQPATFTTACPAITVTDATPYTQGFESNTFDCWYPEIIEGEDNWQVSPDAYHTGSRGIAYSSSVFGDLTNMTDPLDMLSMFDNMTNFGNGAARITSPILDLTAVTGQVKLSFYRKQTTMMIPQTLYVYYRTSPSSNWVPLQQYSSNSGWTGESVVLPNPSATYQVSLASFCDIQGMGNIDPTSMMTDPDAAANFASTIYIDDIRVGFAIQCDDPTNLTFSNISTTSATATWSGTADSWSVEYGEAGFPQGNGTTVTAQNPTYTFTDLTPGTQYDVYVRANCPEDNFSEWVRGNFATTGDVAISENNGIRLTIAPNPTNGTVRCTLSNKSANTRLQVLDVYGKLLMEQTVSDETTELDFSNKASGVYFLRVIDGNSIVTTQKVVRR